MRHVRTYARLILLPALLLLGACATNRSYLSLALPAPGTVVAGDKVAVIETVRDQRRFEADPDDPSTPSLKKGEKYTLDNQGRTQAIARKRNGYGMAIGDFLLEGNATVETVTRDLIAQGLRQRGYRVMEAGAAAPADALTLRVGIDEFWAWSTPGFWAGAIEARVKTAINASQGSSRDIQVVGYGENIVQSGRETNWKQAYERAFEDYLAKLKTALDTVGL